MSDAPRLLVLGGSIEDRHRAARRHTPSTHTVLQIDSRTLPFTRAERVAWPSSPLIVLLDEAEHAFPDSQRSTRLVLTQSTYLLQKWVNLLETDDRIVATADRAALERCAPEYLQGRGCWSAFEILDLDRDLGLEDRGSSDGTRPSAGVHFPALGPTPLAPSPIATLLVRAFSSSDPAERLRLCGEAVALEPQSAVAWLARASACRETRDGLNAREALDRAAALAPQWEAIAFESGKLWLVYDDMARARQDFQRATDLMPTFTAAWSNLGAILGELDEPGPALSAFRQALAHDPGSDTLLNNIGVVSRELGRLDDSEAAFRRVIAINPAFVFGHYNLGHTLFLAGRYREALDAYEEGWRRDPQQNRRQGCRLALARFATGDAAGAELDLWRCADAAPPDEREDLLLEAYEVARGLLMHVPALAPHRAFLDRIGAEITESE